MTRTADEMKLSRDRSGGARPPSLAGEVDGASRRIDTSNSRVAQAFVLILLIASASQALAASEADFKAAYAAAEAAEKEAGTLRNQWLTTETALKAATKAAASGDFDAATSEAKEAEALAKASIFQATSEKERWKDMEIR